MISFPNCKINLGLSITGRFPDGYHRIETVIYPVPLCDMLEIVPAAGNSNRISVSGIPVAGNAEDNLCFKAWNLLNQEFNIGNIDLHLHKNIPSGAGLGGGSGDAAFTLKLLDNIYGLKLGDKNLERLAAQLGMDCPFFIENLPALATGRGESTEPVDICLDGYYLAIIKPDIHISTAEAYAGVTPSEKPVPVRRLIQEPVDKWSRILHNDFEPSVFNRHPEISDIKQRLYASGAVYASMSGSGSAVFGIFTDPSDVKDCFPGCFVWQGLL
ncbi:MAG TPA: 4-(cytidine 5'-diphospho)-2-C-methyl-D-erythritol kinase [Bacteroidales bacterium]|nr:4-(cytidine 5'-diphospho)-2-C-methyl-D-erythritol kinase [Bacteroidales bacterium]